MNRYVTASDARQSRPTQFCNLPRGQPRSQNCPQPVLTLWPRDATRNAVGENANRDGPRCIVSSNRISPSTQRCRIELTEHPAVGCVTRSEKTTVSPTRKRRGSMRNVAVAKVYILARHARCHSRRAGVHRVIKSHIAHQLNAAALS